MESGPPRRTRPATQRASRRLGRPRLLIVGCGDVGLRIVSRLRRRFRILALTSTPARHAALRAAGAVPIGGDLDEPRTLARIAALAPWLIHLAPPGNQGRRDRRTHHLASALRGVRRAVYISTTGVYGDRGGTRIDETTRPSPAHERSWRRLDAERTMRARLDAVVLRVPGIYADDRLPLDRLRQRLPALAAADDVHSNHIHADDLARISIAALARGAPRRVINAADDSDLKMGDYFDLVADAFALPRPPRLPRAQVKAAVSPTMYSFMSESRRLSNRRLHKELRVRLDNPTVAAALARMKNGPAGPLE